MDDDWDLHAVVRGYAAAVNTTTDSTAASAAAATTTTNNHFPGFSFSSFHDDQNSCDFHGQDDRNDPFMGLQEIYQEFCGDDRPPTTAAAAADISATSMMAIPAAQAFQPHQEILQMKPPPQMNMQIQENVHFSNPRLGSSSQNYSVSIPQPIRPRRRKNQQMKMVRQVTQEELSADSWAWRKYGQKPIKGSPYPRNYYRCSTSKGCAARKQVERSPTDPGIFVVSYTGEHTHPRPTHRSSLAGSTRSKFVAIKNSNSNNALSYQKGSISSASQGEAPARNDDEEAEEEEGAGDDDDENITMIPNDLVNDDDDMFKGFQDSDHSSGGGGGDLFSSGFLSSPPWSPTGSACNAATPSGGGGG